MRRGLYVVLVSLAVMVSVATAGASNEVTKESAPNSISISDEDGRVMHFAAAELSRYLKTMTSRDYVITRDSHSGKIRLEIDSRLKHDGFRIWRDAGTTRIAGGSSRGCLYGVYAFLHELGCRWSLPGKEYEFVPKVSEIAWKRPEMKSEPAIRRRGMVYATYGGRISENAQAWQDQVDFMAKNGFNVLFLHTDGTREDMLPDLVEALAQREMGFEFGGHLLPGLLPRDLFTEHPDYFRMENGKRTAELNMCSSNSDAANLMAINAAPYVNFIKRFTSPEVLHMWPDDIFDGGWCSCEKCISLSPSDQALKVVNELAERLPLGDTKLAHLDYHTTLLPPNNVNASDRVCLFFAPRERCYRHPMGGCEVNKRYLRYYKDLVKAMPVDPEVFEYYGDGVLFRLLPMPLHRVIGEDVKAYRKAGVDGIVSLHFETYSDWAYGLNSFVLGRALWRGKGSRRDIEDYCSDIYGPGPVASKMRDYFDLLYELTSTAKQTCGYTVGTDLSIHSAPVGQTFAGNHMNQLRPLVSDEHLDKIEASLRAAMEIAPEPYRSRIEDQSLLFNYARLEVRNIYDQLIVAVEYNKAMREGATDSDKALAITEIEAIQPNFVKRIKEAVAIVMSAPPRLKGPFLENSGRLSDGQACVDYALAAIRRAQTE